jgi:protein-S-isoprenylcysteine O-methyltransferase Ste14
VGGALYRRVWNPMYLGFGVTLLGEALLLQSARILAVVAVFGALAHAFVVLYEEPALLRNFGVAYQNYRAAVPRWLPSLRTRLPKPK